MLSARSVKVARIARAVLARALALMLAASVATIAPRPSAWAAQATQRVGALELRRCGHEGAYCGSLPRALDPDGTVPGVLEIYFEFYPHTAPGPAAGTLVATEGGPGYPATGSRDDYLSLFKPLMVDHDVVIMDNRGTGRSGAVDCPQLQQADHWTIDGVAQCGRSLGDRAPFYSTAFAADDLAAVLGALGVDKIDLYGDSYGTYFEQVYALRHPATLRTVVLDGAYPLAGPDYAWYPTYAPAMRDKFNRACARSSGCAAVPGTSIDHVLPALAALRKAPFDAHGIDVDGTQRHFHADASSFAIVLFGNAPALTSTREADAAARAFAAGDRLPLLRLMAESAAAVDSRDPAHRIDQWSAGLAAAVMCQDPPQIFDMRLAPAQRLADRDRALEERRRVAPDTYFPFTIDEYRGMPLDYSFVDECVGWPTAPPRHPAAQLGTAQDPFGNRYPDVPALIVSGEFDALTSPADGAAVAAEFPHGRQVLIANSFHVNALPRARSDCGAGIVRTFLRSGTAGDATCADQVPPLRLLTRFTRSSRDLPAAAQSGGGPEDERELQTVAAAVLTAGDILARAVENTSGHGVGLRGGTFRVRHSPRGLRAELDHIRWVEDVAVTGHIDAPPDRLGTVGAVLTVTADGGGPAGTLTVSWPSMDAAGLATIQGLLGTHRVSARVPAP